MISIINNKYIWNKTPPPKKKSWMILCQKKEYILFGRLPELIQFYFNDSFGCNNMAGGITSTRLFDALQFYIGSEIESMQSLTCGPIYRSWSIFILLSSLIPWTPSIQGLTCNRSCNFFWQQKYTVGLNGLDKWNLWAPSTEGVEESTAGCVHTHCQPPTLLPCPISPPAPILLPAPRPSQRSLYIHHRKLVIITQSIK